MAPSENFRAVLRELESKQYLEVWENSKLIRNVDLAALELHGNVYTDGKRFCLSNREILLSFFYFRGIRLFYLVSR